MKNIVSLVDAPALDEHFDAVAVVDPGRSTYDRLARGLWSDKIKVYRAGPAPTEARGAALLVLVLSDRPDWEKVAGACAAQPTLLIAPQPSAEDGLRAIDIAARGYLPAAISDRALLDAIRGIRAGEVAFSRIALGNWLRTRAADPSNSAVAKLTPRQRQIVSLVARGASDKEIGGVLGISTATAQKHVTNLLRRLGAPYRAAAVAMIAGQDIGSRRRVV
jgi:DNA-binding NarL/FixJ family response regulator